MLTSINILFYVKSFKIKLRTQKHHFLNKYWFAIYITFISLKWIVQVLQKLRGTLHVVCIIMKQTFIIFACLKKHERLQKETNIYILCRCLKKEVCVGVNSCHLQFYVVFDDMSRDMWILGYS